MAESPYLVALALIEQDGKRGLPLTGKTQPADALEANDPGEGGRTLALELLLRLWQRSSDGAIRRAADEGSLLLLELPLEAMQEHLPQLKAAWLSTGDTAALHQALAGLALRGWTVGIAKYEPITFRPWPA